MSRNYRIGQVLYIVVHKSRTVIPVQVVEINTKKTTEGETTTFLVQDPKKRGNINLDEVAGDVFLHHTDVVKFLKEAANKAVDEMISNVLEVAAQSFSSGEVVDQTTVPVRKVEQPQEPQHPNQHPKVNGEIEVAGVNGQPQKARIRSIKLPEGFAS